LTAYLKSKFLPEPVVYVQEDTEWRSYAPGGSVTQSAGRIPAGTLALLEAMDPVEAEGLIRNRRGEAAKAQLQAGRAERESGSSRTVNLALRYSGIVLPFGAPLALFSNWEVSGWLLLFVSVGLWLAFIVALLVRRDYRGVLAITLIYIALGSWVALLFV
jgi:hypothetical protein